MKKVELSNVINSLPSIPLHILNEIQDNPAFEFIFKFCVDSAGFVETFNRMFNASINFNIVEPKNGLEAMIDQATGFNGFAISESDLAKFIIFVYEAVYLVSQDQFQRYEQQKANNEQ